MAKPSVYIETTIVSYLTARPSRDLYMLAHQGITRDWWEQCGGNFDLFTSNVVIEEASAGDSRAAAERLASLDGILILRFEARAIGLAAVIADSLQLPPRAKLDAAHVAIAAVHNLRYLLTWNCRHLANAFLDEKIQKACAKSGYDSPRIVTPDLLMGAP